jgi:flagellar FliJ protein
MENEAQRAFQEAVAKLNAEIARLEFLNEQVIEARQKAFQVQVKGGAATNDLHQVGEFIKGQDIRIERQNVAIEKQQLIVEDLRQILRKAALDYKIIEKLRDKKKEEFRIESRKHEQKQIDELTNARENLVEEE